MMSRIQSKLWRSFLLPKRCKLFSSSTNPKPPLFPEELNIIFDSKCNICKLEMDFLSGRDARRAGSSVRKLRLTDIESEDYDPNDPSNGGVSYEKGMATIHAVTADGRVIEGVPVFGKAYTLVGLGWLFKFTEWPMMKPLVRWGYDFFAKYRTNVTRGTSLDDLIKAHNAKKMLKKGEDQTEECSRCNNLRQ
eukprot:CAMPEP_0183783972 /NCGR_PEP_ID=MMETSP0739-20130205/64845_1 /TAXON_ID=385413 /ORGANISM="Thalassiosira miniscula, Strain CCMP1093" /LENGTH=191 /DNA_ID=CAMNT_0026027795 /DNA_START=1 /DNA_END=576 /DNA_ORIENTATION=-